MARGQEYPFQEDLVESEERERLCNLTSNIISGDNWAYGPLSTHSLYVNKVKILKEVNPLKIAASILNNMN